MLTLRQAIEVKESIIEYLRSTFSFSDKETDRAFSVFIQGMFKGPYISLRLPFKKADENSEIPFDLEFKETPFKHQMEAFKRLSSKDGHTPRPTLLTTGTGSGKTEAFMYPLLDYCARNTGKKGIKAIILYPMNALATDQAKRFAEGINSDEVIKGKLTVGLLIGESLDKTKEYSKRMTSEKVIEHRDEIINNPPDILMTNFKMLDLALMRGEFDSLWYHNFKDNNILKFLVFDELHTYEGAQGSDVAHLVRRLKMKLGIPNGQICPIGTSATIGKGEESKALLAAFASKVFGEDVDEAAVIGEERVDAGTFFGDQMVKNFIPTDYLLRKSELTSGEDFNDFVKKQLDAWGIDPNIGRIEVGEYLKNYKVVRDLIDICNEGVIGLSELIEQLGKRNIEISSTSISSDSLKGTLGENLITSILSLISYAGSGSPEKIHPFLNLQVQLWIRELSGVMKVISSEPVFKWKEYLDFKEKERALPMYYCRECGSSGWLGVISPKNGKVEANISDAYAKYFSHHSDLYFIVLDNAENSCSDEYQPRTEMKAFLDPKSLVLTQKETPRSLQIVAYKKEENGATLHICPACNTRNTVNIIGQGLTTLVSVASSQVLATDLDNSSEKERKILIFSNAVQDAAHLSGFIEARNFRFTFRTALQIVINQSEGPLNLIELQQRFIRYWEKNASQNGEGDLESYFLKFFPPDHKADVKIEHYRKDVEKLRNEFNNRVKWEIASEFGYNAKIGRTLEKTGSSGTFFDEAKLREVYSVMKPWLEQNSTGEMTEASFLKFLIVFLHRLRTRGGVDHPYLKAFRTDRSNYILLTQGVPANSDHFLMRNFGRNTRLPKLITNQPYRYNVFDATYRESYSNWFHNYAERCFWFLSGNKALINDLYSELLSVMASDKLILLDEKTGDGIRNFAISPHALLIGTETIIFECEKCGNRLTTTQKNEELLDGAICIMNRCKGVYRKTAGIDLKNYYKTVYNRGRSPRVFTADHTGLLDRKVRESIEIDFKTRPNLNSVNTLVATSTLEMGIDVGSLNTVINASIPPTPSNFLQRVGRAGRRTGSALVLNFCLNKAHDLYFFGDPVEMMDGMIHTPGCFLDAREILRRHFLAFCFDSWSKSDPVNNRIPHRIRFMGLNTLDRDRGESFLNRVIIYIQQNQEDLLEQYEGSYQEHLELQYLQQIRNMVECGDLFNLIWTSFFKLQKEIFHIREKFAEVENRKKNKNLAREDSEFKELDTERRNLAAIGATIKNMNVIEFMVNEGLLPNYAFPETGVSLKASIAKKSGTDDHKYELQELEVVRPASSAIREFAPVGHFYTQGYKLAIDSVNVASWSEECLTYRYCSDCDNIEVDSVPLASSCSKCGSESWQQPQNVHSMLKMRSMRSFNNEKKALLDDRSEDRIQSLSLITSHFRFHPVSSGGALIMRKIPFGIEYFKDVDVIEINCGLKTPDWTQCDEIKINNRMVDEPGFLICKYCGRVSNSHMNDKGDPKKPEEYHFGFCRAKETGFFEDAEDNNDRKVFEKVFFRREMSTEALKILLPVKDFETESAVKLFKAGLTIGLKKYFRGTPEHLRIKEYSEHNFQSHSPDNYLVISDNVPGGTGYLSRLFNPDQFNLILSEAYKTIKECSCQFDGRDGCYNCIFTYGNQFERESLSRQRAEELFEQIVNSAGDWDLVTHGLGSLTIEGQVEESELEKRFIRTLGEYAKATPGMEFEIVKEDGKVRYNLRIKGDNQEVIIEIIPQYHLGPSGGIKYSTVADFLIRPLFVKINGEEVNDLHQKYKPIVIYLDGYVFHANEKNNRVISDLQKRMNIINSGRYFVWVLTWDDLDIYESTKENDLLWVSANKKLKDYTKIAQVKNLNARDPELMESRDSFTRLIWLIKNLVSDHPELFLQNYMTLFQPEFPYNLFSKEDIMEYLSNKLKTRQQMQNGKFNDGLFILTELCKGNVLQTRAVQSLRGLNVTSVIFAEHIATGYDQQEWMDFWRLFNILQFTGEGISLIMPDEAEEAEGHDDIPDVLSEFDPRYHEVINEFIRLGVDFHRSEYFALVKDETIIAEASIGLPDWKIVIDPLGEESEAIFTANGYKVYNFDDFSIEKLEDK